VHAVAFPVVVPLLLAAVLAGCSAIMPRRLADTIASLTALFNLVVCAWLLRRSLNGPIVYWFGNWSVDAHHFPIGITFLVDPSAAAMAGIVSLLVLAALVFTWNYFESVKSLFHALMLVFLAAMCGLCLTGDLFNLFIWFELMTATAVTLCGYKAEETGPLQGALTFAVTNTIGAFLSLTGVSLLYAWSGSLNFAGIAQGLAQHPPGSTYLAVAFIFTITGFLVKAAAVPFHFWLPDAHAVAPTPVCILFSGIMVPLGLFAITRIYFGIFAGSFSVHETTIRHLLITIGSLSAIVGAIECFGQRHIKRMLAFSTISHTGVMLIGLGLLNSLALAGAGCYLLGHAMVKGALFIGAGILLHHFSSVDEFDLHGKAKKYPGLAVIMIVAAMGLLALPPFGTFFGEAMIERAAEQADLHWLSIIFIIASIFTGGTLLRVIGRVFFGLGSGKPPVPGRPEGREDRETTGPPGSTPISMWLPPVALLLIGVTVTVLPSIRLATVQHATNLIDTHLFAATVLYGNTLQLPRGEPLPEFSVWRPLIALAGALGLAAVAIYPEVNPAGLLKRFLLAVSKAFQIFQSGRVGDYVAWLVLGIAAWGGWLLLALR
jgi:multicomponent Na+:H+ antiporter subunit D